MVICSSIKIQYRIFPGYLFSSPQKLNLLQRFSSVFHSLEIRLASLMLEPRKIPKVFPVGQSSNTAPVKKRKISQDPAKGSVPKKEINSLWYSCHPIWWVTIRWSDRYLCEHLHRFFYWGNSLHSIPKGPNPGVEGRLLAKIHVKFLRLRQNRKQILCSYFLLSFRWRYLLM